MTSAVAENKDAGVQENRGQKRTIERTEQEKRSLKKMKVAQLLGIEQPVTRVDETKTALSVSGDWEVAKAITRKMQDRGMPLTILTGFLGAGKSTILNYILKADHKLKIAVLINEFGEVDIDNQLVDTMTKGEDGEPVVLNNGCICCTVSQGFLTAVNQVLQRADDIGSYPDYILVETTGLADPKPIVDSISGTELRSDIYVDQVLTVVDASVWGEDHYGSETAKKQIQSADTILLSKIDLIKDEKRLKEVIASIISIRPGARILRSQKGHVPIAALFDMELAEKPKPAPVKKDKHDHNHSDHDHKENGHSHDHKDGEGHDHKHEGEHGHKDKHGHDHKHDHEDKDGHDHKHDHEHDHKDKDGHDHKHDHDHKDKDGHDHKHDHKHGHGHDHHHGHDHKHGEACDDPTHDHSNHLEAEGFGSMSFVTSSPLSLRRFRDCFMENLPDNVFRAKGLLYFDKYDMRFVFHWSGQRYNVEEEEWPMDAEKKNQLVVIGRNLDQKHITKMLEDCVVKPGEESEDEEYMYADDGEYGEDYGEEYGEEYGGGYGEGYDAAKAGMVGMAGDVEAGAQVNDGAQYGMGAHVTPQYGVAGQEISNGQQYTANAQGVPPY